MEVGDTQCVVLGVVREQVLIQNLGHVVDGARVRGVEDLLVNVLASFFVGYLYVEVAFWDLHAGSSVAVHAHGSQVYQVDVQTRFDNRGEQIVGGVHVVVHRVTLVFRPLHGIRSGPLLCKVNDSVRRKLSERLQQLIRLGCHVEVAELKLVARDFFPRLDALLNRSDRSEGLCSEFIVNSATRQIVDNHDVVATLRQVQHGGPATEAVSTENDNLHSDSPLAKYAFFHLSVCALVSSLVTGELG